MRGGAIAGLTLAALWVQEAAEKPPRFDDYRVNEKFIGQPAEPRLATSRQRSFRSKIREAAQSGANFAGHYRLATWGCGSSCVSGALIDLKTGTVYELPFETIDVAARFRFDDGSDSRDERLEPVDLRANSRLLILHGCLTESERCAAHYYEWTGTQFRLVRSYAAHRMNL